MARLGHALAFVILLCGTLFFTFVTGYKSPFELSQMKAQIRSKATRQSRDSSQLTGKNITFSNPKASEFWVDGKTIPQVDFDVGSSWAGLMPISPLPDEKRKLFFWLFPPGPLGSLDDLIFWTNGGPGCSSMEGLLQEHGPFVWSKGQIRPTQNEWSWTNLSSVLYVEQPVGTGFSQGTPTARNEDDVAAQLVGFFQQFLEIFSELKGKKFYLTGESYAGMYVPYIANFIYEHTTKSTLDLDLKGIWINDPVLGFDVDQQIPAVQFVHKYENVFAFNQTFLAHLDSVAAACNYTGYMDKYVVYPPHGSLPLPGNSTEFNQGCDVWTEIALAALIINPAFNIYHIFDMAPEKFDPLGFPGSFLLTPSPDNPLYFNRADVKAAIHAPENVDWVLCTDVNVFPNGDASLPPTFTVLPNVIEKSERAVIANGRADFIIMAEGSRIALQNMTWGGKQGFQTPMVPDSFIVDGVGALGSVQNERGLTYVEINQAGHMLPADKPQAAFQVMQYLMGFRKAP
ncbi:alpha/beta-hydrolase [Lactifluus volemus]|nr:alpha/beta-hydrolase [Lactifluus volemus]